jgi:hypothetical protein
MSTYGHAMLSCFHHRTIASKNSYVFVALIGVCAIKDKITNLYRIKGNFLSASVVELVTGIMGKGHSLCLEKGILCQATAIIADYVGVIVTGWGAANAIGWSTVIATTPGVL